jgi:hypothetical protein
MADHRRRQNGRDDDLIPLITGLVVLAAAGPALYAAATQWLTPRLTAGRDAVSLTLAEWWDRNWWLAAFWLLELAVLFGFLAWRRRRLARRTRQMDSVITGLSRVMPADWESTRDLRVLRWSGHRPVRLRLQLTPRAAMDDSGWRRSVAEAATKVLGPLDPLTWPKPPRGGVYDWGRRPPYVQLQVRSEAPVERRTVPLDSDNRTYDRSANAASAADVQPFYRRPRPDPARVPAEHGSAPTRLDRED